MIDLLVGTAAIVTIFIVLYSLGLLPNLWSNEIIHYTSVEDACDRGLKVVGIICIVAIVVVVLYGIGLMINHLIYNL